MAVLVHLHREESHDPRVHRFADDVEQVGTALVRSVALTRTPSLVRAQHVTMVISAFVRPLHAVLVQHSRYQIIQNDILPPLVGWWCLASGISRLFLQPYFASYAEAVSSVLNPPLGGELVPALVAAPCRTLREFGIAVIARTATPPVRTDAGTSTARLLALAALPPVVTDAGTSTLLAPTANPPMLADAGTSTLLAPTARPPMGADAGTSTLLARFARPPMGTDAGTSTLLAIILLFSMRTRFQDKFSLLCNFNTHSNRLRHELERVWGSSLHGRFNTFFHGLESELGRVLVWELHARNSMSVLEYAAIPRGPVCLGMLSEARVGPKLFYNYFTV